VGGLDSAQLQTLVAEAMKRSDLVWLTYPGSGRPRAVWHVWHDGAAYVVSGGPEQPLPGIEKAAHVLVTARAKDTRARLVTWVADAAVERVGTDSWWKAAELLKAERLNASQGDALFKTWAAKSTITRLVPTGEVTEYPGAYPAESLAAAPVESPATTSGKLPWVAHRRASRAPRL
jgi:hypothetical protein